MREFGIFLSPNVCLVRSNHRELTPEERAAIIAARKAGVTRKALAANFRGAEILFDGLMVQAFRKILYYRPGLSKLVSLNISKGLPYPKVSLLLILMA